jgi:hypothetical protein
MYIAVPDVFFFTFCNRVKLVDYTHSLKLHTDIHASVHAAESFSRTTVELFCTLVCTLLLPIVYLLSLQLSSSFTFSRLLSATDYNLLSYRHRRQVFVKLYGLMGIHNANVRALLQKILSQN